MVKWITSFLILLKVFVHFTFIELAITLFIPIVIELLNFNVLVVWLILLARTWILLSHLELMVILYSLIVLDRSVGDSLRANGLLNFFFKIVMVLIKRVIGWKSIKIICPLRFVTVYRRWNLMDTLLVTFKFGLIVLMFNLWIVLIILRVLLLILGLL